MARSYNGWKASPNRNEINVEPLNVAGETFPGGVRAHIVGTVLGYVAEQFHKRVEKIHPGWCWGFAYRANRNASNLSNHASGTAIDINAPRHPNGVPTRNTFSAKQIREIHEILREVDNVVRWGGDYTGTPDAMHFEINAGVKEVERVAHELRAGKRKAPAKVARKVAVKLTPAKRRAIRKAGVVHARNVNFNRTNKDIKEVQRVLNAWYPHLDLQVDGVYGPNTNDALNLAADRLNVRPKAKVNKNIVARRRTLRKLGFKVIG